MTVSLVAIRETKITGYLYGMRVMVATISSSDATVFGRVDIASTDSFEPHAMQVRLLVPLDTNWLKACTDAKMFTWNTNTTKPIQNVMQRHKSHEKA